MPTLIPQKPFGKTGKKVSVVGMGCSPFGHAYGTPDEAAAFEAVQEAFKQGVNFFDVAPFYAAGDAEKLLGRCIKDLPREEVFVATKVGKYKPGEPEDFSAERVTRSVHESLERLQLSYIDLIHCHDIESAVDMMQIVKETIPALVKLREQGLVRAIGITGLPLDIYTYILDRVPEGSVDAILSYCHNNLSDNTLVALLAYLEKKGVAVISASFSSMGLLTQKAPPSWHPASKEALEAAQKCRDICAAKGTDLATLAIKFFVRTPGVNVHLMGMATPEEVNTDLKVVREALDLEPCSNEAAEAAALKEVEVTLKPVLDQTWHTGRKGNRT
jgi:L-galactose dehydrogenase